MRLVRLLVLILLPAVAASLLTGCTPPPPKVVPPPPPLAATPEQTVAVQTDLNKINPGARVGHVASVMTDSKQAAVAGIPAADVHKGDSVQFTDSKQNPVANGTVYSIDTSNPDYVFVIVDYDYTGVAGGRAPALGDLAFYLPSH